MRLHLAVHQTKSFEGIFHLECCLTHTALKQPGIIMLKGYVCQVCSWHEMLPHILHTQSNASDCFTQSNASDSSPPWTWSCRTYTDVVLLLCGVLNGAGELAFWNINVNILRNNILFEKVCLGIPVEAFKVHSKSPYESLNNFPAMFRNHLLYTVCNKILWNH